MKGSRISSLSMAPSSGIARADRPIADSSTGPQLDRTDTRILTYLNNVSNGHAVQANVAPIESGSSGAWRNASGVSKSTPNGQIRMASASSRSPQSLPPIPQRLNAEGA